MTDLLERCRDPGFTPGVRDVDELGALWQQADSDRAALRRRRKAVTGALARGDRGVAGRLLAQLSDTEGEAKAMRLQVLGRLHARLGLPELAEPLLAGLHDASATVVREAARGWARCDDLATDEAQAALLAVAESAQWPERRAAVEALGRIADESASARLRAISAPDQDFARRVDEAVTLIERRSKRRTESKIVADVALPETSEVTLRCRAGAAPFVVEQVRRRLGVDAQPSRTEVALRHEGSLAALQQVRTAIDFGLRFGLPDAAELEARIVAALEQPALVTAMRAWTRGAIRFRLAISGSGRRRAVVWRVAHALRERGSPLTNDSRDAPWLVEVDPDADSVRCVPRGGDDRFAYRLADVPAASHPSLAALLAFVGAPQADQRVWDPCCGSGSELVECARLEPSLRLEGTDPDADALAAARRNLGAAGVEAKLHHGDATTAEATPAPGTVDLALCNPPMGRRLARDGTMRPLLTALVERIATCLAPGGRLVWVTPSPQHTSDAGLHAGLDVDTIGTFDMRGFEVGLQRMRRRA